MALMPFPIFQAAGALATDIVDQTLSIVAPACQKDDILIAQVINKALTVAISPPDATWTQLYQADADCATAADDHRAALYWKRAAQADSGATFNFTKASGTVLFAGVISAWRGCNPFVPIDKAGVASQVNTAAAENVTFPAYNPAAAEAHVAFFAFYGNDLTTFGAAMSSDVNPDCTNRYDLESASGNDCSLACTSGNSDGSNIASRTWASVSTTDAGSTALVGGLVAVPVLPNNYQSVRADDGMAVTERVR
jgi:hypothetical protein